MVARRLLILTAQFIVSLRSKSHYLTTWLRSWYYGRYGGIRYLYQYANKKMVLMHKWKGQTQNNAPSLNILVEKYVNADVKRYSIVYSRIGTLIERDDMATMPKKYPCVFYNNDQIVCIDNNCLDSYYADMVDNSVVELDIILRVMGYECTHISYHTPDKVVTREPIVNISINDIYKPIKN